MGGSWRFLRPWILGMLAWLGVSLVVMTEYLGKQDPRYLTEIWFLLSLLWMEFGLAGLFYVSRKRKWRNIALMILVTLLPPLALKFINFLLAWHLGVTGFPANP